MHYARGSMEVLQLDMSGRPQAWISAKEAAVIYASDGVAWTLGEDVLRPARRHAAAHRPAIADRGAPDHRRARLGAEPRLAPYARASNPKLFARDRQVCAYCGGHFHLDDLTREHIVPDFARRQRHLDELHHRLPACNGHKGNRMPEEAHMSLMYLPYVPSLHEDMILRGRRILADQMEFLLASVPRHSRLHGDDGPWGSPEVFLGRGAVTYAVLMFSAVNGMLPHALASRREERVGDRRARSAPSPARRCRPAFRCSARA